MNSKFLKKDFILKLLIALGVSFITIIFTDEHLLPLGPVRELELKYIDERFQERGPVPFKDSARVIIVEITQECFEGIPSPQNTWPWPRNLFAKLIENLNRAGARAIGIDLIMSNPDRISPANDSLLTSVIRKYHNVVSGGKVEYDASRIVETSNGGGGSKFAVQKLTENYNNIFYQADSSIGIVMVPRDNDGTCRRYLPFTYSPTNGVYVPTFSFALINKYYGLPASQTAEIGRSEIILGNHRIPLYSTSSMMINFYGPDRTFPRVSFLHVIDDSSFKTKEELELDTDINMWDNPDYGILHSGIFKDKIVLIGSTMPEDKDIVPVSYAKGERQGDNQIYGIEFHANALQNIIEDNYIYRLPSYMKYLLIIILGCLSVLLTSFIKELKVKHNSISEMGNLLIMGLLSFAVYWLAFLLFRKYNIIIEFISPVIAISFGYISATAFHLVKERKQKAVIKGMFSQYLSKDVVEQLVSNPEKLKLGGEKKELTVFFSDVVGFSTFSERKTPEELVTLMNSYFTRMTEIILKNKGTLDKYVGDAVMAFWGAPIPMENHAFLACKAALEMQSAIAEFREKWTIDGRPIINVRMGINTGDMVVGNIGGKERFDYTVMGDNVNLASRLEGANKEYGTSIMLSETTYEKVKDIFHFRELDLLVVKGRTKPIKVYELIDYKENISPERMKAIEVFHEALRIFREKKFQEALELFRMVLILAKGDSTAEVYMKRCEYYLENPPVENWDGTFIMKVK